MPEEEEPLFELPKPLDPLEPLEPLEEVVEDEDVVEELEPELELELEFVVLLAVGVEDEVLSVPVDEEPDELEELLLVELEPVPEDELLVCVALGSVAATASEPATPLTATIAVIVAVRALPCRTERAAPSASMAQLRQGKLSIRDP